MKDEQVRITTRRPEAAVAPTQIVNGTVKLVNDADSKLVADSFVPASPSRRFRGSLVRR
jgi:hypothetical protein